MKTMRRPFGIVICLLALWLAPAAAQAAAPAGIIRDTEIEATLRAWAEPVMRAAGLNPDSVRIVLVQDDSINAFVAGGQNIFIYTGLLLKSENAAEVIGVLAHELGHISGGHLIRSRDAMETASYESILGTVLGIGAAIVTGDGRAAAAVSAGSQAGALNRLMAFSRVQESSADQAALTFLERAQMSPAGLASFMKKLEDDELVPARQQAEYIRTHPLTRDRVSSLEAGLARSPYRDTPFSSGVAAEHARMVAKLTGFLHPERAAWNYNDRDNGIPARYARAIAAYRQNKVQDALRLTDGLLASEPANPYFLELKGQMLVDFGRVSEAVPLYRKALAQKPDAALIRIAYAHALIETAGNDKVRLQQAVDDLTRAARDEPRNSRLHRLLATAYGRQGQEALARLHLAEEAFLLRRRDEARSLAKAASAALPEGSPGWLRAQDILKAVDSVKNDGEDEEE